MRCRKAPWISQLWLPPGDTQRSEGREKVIIWADLTLVPSRMSVYCDPAGLPLIQLGSLLVLLCPIGRVRQQVRGRSEKGMEPRALTPS